MDVFGGLEYGPIWMYLIKTIVLICNWVFEYCFKIEQDKPVTEVNSSLFIQVSFILDMTKVRKSYFCWII